VDFTGTAQVGAPPDRVFAEVADLSTYPAWMGLVASAEPADTGPEDPRPAWVVEMVMRIGPMIQKKAVRMVRTACVNPETARFERVEIDGRDHSDWVLTAEVRSAEGGVTGAVASHLTMHLHYGGLPSLPFVDKILTQEVEESAARLQARLAAD